MRRAYLVYNPIAGRFPSRMLTERAGALLKRYGWHIRLEKTRNAAHLSQLAHQAAQEGMDAFFLVGGDGSINYALPGLIGSSTALAILPAGTGNVWAQELGLPGLGWTRWTALEESARRLAEAPTHVIDVGYCNDRPFLLWAGVGLDAFIMHRLQLHSHLEKQFFLVEYAATTIWTASQWRGIELRAELENQQITGRYLLAVVSNVRLYAGGLASLTPNACLNDGLMDLWLFQGQNVMNVVQLAIDLLSGRHVQSENVQRFPIGSLRLESDNPMFIQMDGEPVKTEDGINVRVQCKALHILAPENTPRPLFCNELTTEPR